MECSIAADCDLQGRLSPSIGLFVCVDVFVLHAFCGDVSIMDNLWSNVALRPCLNVYELECV